MAKERVIVVRDWMMLELKLSGNELLVYAMIYNFSSEGGENCFYESFNTLGKFINISRSTSINVLQSLLKKGLIYKKDRERQSSQYWADLTKLNMVEKLHQPSVDNTPDSVNITLPPSVEITPNSKVFNNKYNNKEKENASIVFFEEVFKFYKTLTTVGSHKGQAGERFKRLSDVKQQKLFEYLKEYSGRRQKIEAAKGWLRPLPAFEKFIRDGYWENVDLPEVKHEAKQIQKSNIKIFLG